MINEHKKHYIALNMVQGVGPVLASKLIKHFGRIENIFNAKIEQLVKIPFLSQAIAKRITTIMSSQDLSNEIDQISKQEVEIICLDDTLYPELLKQIYDPPIALYLKGDISLLRRKKIAIVGCRKASSNGLSFSEKIAKDLSGENICVVSGLARGIDTAAHKGALLANGGTIAVLGSGFNHVYPPENRDLFDQIGEHGILISEYSLSTKPSKSSFPRRNRIISGLCFGVVVVEAAKRSGSLITANLALSQNREVFAVPGLANSLNAKGTNLLIKQGAKLIENVEDILEEFKYSFYEESVIKSYI